MFVHNANKCVRWRLVWFGLGMCYVIIVDGCMYMNIITIYEDYKKKRKKMFACCMAMKMVGWLVGSSSSPLTIIIFFFFRCQDIQFFFCWCVCVCVCVCEGGCRKSFSLYVSYSHTHKRNYKFSLQKKCWFVGWWKKGRKYTHTYTDTQRSNFVNDLTFRIQLAGWNSSLEKMKMIAR